jgi:hypothetical protein
MCTSSWENGIELANEFATVNIRVVRQRNGSRLEITSPKLGFTILLDPLELESLTWQSPNVFSQFLIDPFGPVGE